MDPSRKASAETDNDNTTLGTSVVATDEGIGISDLHQTSRTDGTQEHVGNIIIIDDIVVQIIIIDVIVQ